LSVGAKPNMPLVRLAKIEFKKCAMGKIKNTEGSAMSVGLLVVLLKFGCHSSWKQRAVSTTEVSRSNEGLNVELFQML